MRTTNRVCVLSMIAASAAHAQSLPNYPDFSSVAGLNFAGVSAFQNGNELRLTRAIESEIAQVWYADKVPVSGGFVAEFDLRISNPGGVPDWYGFLGADGFAFVIQNDNAFAFGASGSGMGYGGIPHSLAVEFDTWGHPFFGDPDSNHVSVQTLFDLPNSHEPIASLGLNGNILELTSAAVIRARIEYAPGQLTVYVDDMINPALDIAVDLTLLGLDNGTAWVGFTSSTGGAFENHDLLNWTMSAGQGCYPDCDANGVLDIFDFLCFQNSFVAGEPYACDCEPAPVCDIFDFLCFQNAFVGGCP